MLSVYLICVGKLKEKFYQEACAEYIKRLSPYCRLTLVELPEEKLPQDPSQAQIDAALEKESQAIRAKLPPSTSLVCLCVEGRLRSSEEPTTWPGSCCWNSSTGPSRSGRAPATTNDRVPGLKTCSPWIRPKIRWKFMPACGTMSTTACPSGFY